LILPWKLRPIGKIWHVWLRPTSWKWAHPFW
jgi:hypothetical protein